MDTSLSDRLFSDPRLKQLTRELGCPFRALGVLGYLWHGSQNVGVSVSDECFILDTFPLGVRGPRKIVASLVRCGWLEQNGEQYRIVGNDEHLQRLENLSKRGKRAANIRWHDDNATSMHDALHVALPETPDPQCSKMPSPLLSSPLLSSLKEGGEERARATPPDSPNENQAPPFVDFDGFRPRLDGATTKLLVGTHRSLLKSIRQRQAPTRATPSEEKAAQTIGIVCGADAVGVIEYFIRAERKFYSDNSWPLEVCARDLSKLYDHFKRGVPLPAETQTTGKAYQDQGQPSRWIPGAEETAEMLRQREQEIAAEPSDPEATKKIIAETKRKMGISR